MAIKGGKRANAGRKPGQPNKKTQELIQAVREEGIMPLEHMLNVVRAPMPTQMKDESPEAFIARCKYHIQRQDAMAASAAPYLHPRLSAVEVKRDPEQFAKEQQAKLDAMDTTEIARRLAFFLAEQQRKRQKEKSNAQGNQGRQGGRQVEEGIRH